MFLVPIFTSVVGQEAHIVVPTRDRQWSLDYTQDSSGRGKKTMRGLIVPMANETERRRAELNPITPLGELGGL